MVRRRVLNSQRALELAKELKKLGNSKIIFQIKLGTYRVEVVFTPCGFGKADMPHFRVYGSLLSSKELNEICRKLEVKIKQLKRFIELFREKEKEYLMYNSLIDEKFASLPPLDQVEVFSKAKIREIESSLEELGPPPPFLTIERVICNERDFRIGKEIGKIVWKEFTPSPGSVCVYGHLAFPSYQELDIIEEAAREFKEIMKKFKESTIKEENRKEV